MSGPAGILLAAGRSSRLGREKQKLSVKGKTFLGLVATEMAAVASPLVVVLAAGRGDLLRELGDFAADIVWNPNSAAGMGTSLALGARELHARSEAGGGFAGVLVALVDQPLADRDLFARLERAASAGAGGGYAACDYGDGAWGVPARFPASALPELATLAGDRGAKALLERRRSAGGLPLVAFPGGRLDVDSEADYERLLRALAGEPDVGSQ